MTQKCANPTCVTTTPHLIRGKMTKFDNRPQELSNKKYMQIYWLCPSCSERFDLLFRDDSVAIVPRE